MQQGAGSGPYRGRLRYDRDFFFELQICSEYGIPHSTFLAWDTDDQAKAIAFAIEKGMRCGLCGTAGWEWDETQGGSRHAYQAVENFCHGCYALAAARVNDPNRNSDGVSVELVIGGGAAGARRLLKQKLRASEASG